VFLSISGNQQASAFQPIQPITTNPSSAAMEALLTKQLETMEAGHCMAERYALGHMHAQRHYAHRLWHLGQEMRHMMAGILTKVQFIEHRLMMGSLPEAEYERLMHQACMPKYDRLMKARFG
jgi:hypothetical protein